MADSKRSGGRTSKKKTEKEKAAPRETENREPRETREPRENREMRDSAQDDYEERAPQEERAPRVEAVPERRTNNRPVPNHPTRDYALQVNFDPHEKRYVATAVEFSGLRGFGDTRADALADLEEILENELAIMKNRGEMIPEPLSQKVYPDKLEITVSQGLFRKLDHVSRQERVDFDKLVVELISSAVERRFDKGGSRQSAPQQHRAHHDNHRRGGHHGGNHQKHGHRHGGRGNQPSNRQMHDENFLEYVRNLEKGGGTPGWKKR